MRDAERDDLVDQLRLRDGEIEGLQAALRAARRIGVAMGVLMALHKIDADEAFGRLSTASQLVNRKVRDVAEDVIETGELPAAAPSRRQATCRYQRPA